jgi:hypothetical protein
MGIMPARTISIPSGMHSICFKNLAVAQDVREMDRTEGLEVTLNHRRTRISGFGCAKWYKQCETYCTPSTSEFER